MTLTIDFTPTEEERLAAAARRKGLEPAEFIKGLVREHLPGAVGSEVRHENSAQNSVNRDHFYFTATREEFNNALDEIAQLNRSLPELNDAAFDRENLYEDGF